MRKPYHKPLREILTAHPDGLGTTTLAEMTCKCARSIYKSLKSMSDVYVDRWSEPRRGQYVAIWCAIKVPDDCPKPRKNRPVETVWRTA